MRRIVWIVGGWGGLRGKRSWEKSFIACHPEFISGSIHKKTRFRNEFGMTLIMSFLIINLTLLVIIIFLLLVLSMVWPPDSPWSPWWRTNKKVARAMCNLAKIGKDDTVYDLGSGTGTALIVAAKEFGARGVGIEIDPLRYFISTLLLRRNRVLNDKVKIIKKNFFNVDISDASVVFVYLVPKALARLLPKFKKELKKGTRIVSYRYRIDGLVLFREDKSHKVYLYKL